MSTTITEDEAALYDRQIRLWGLDAQQKMRNATVLVVHLRGVATETIKNIVLAGIGKLIVMDDALVQAEDVSTSFFFRDEDIGAKRRVDAARPHIESLNPLVKVEVAHDLNILSDESSLKSFLKKVDLVCLTETDRTTSVRVNDAARSLGKKFYCAGSFGISGYVFCDLLQHKCVVTLRNPPGDGPKTRLEQTETTYVPLSQALEHSWRDTTSSVSKALRPITVFSLLACWEYQTQYGTAPASKDSLQDLEKIANGLLKKAQVRQKVCTSIPPEILSTFSETAAHEWSPSCAVIGGMLGQDILKALSAREAPMANFFFFDGETGNGTVVRMSMNPPPNQGPPPSLGSNAAETSVLEID